MRTGFSWRSAARSPRSCSTTRRSTSTTSRPATRCARCSRPSSPIPRVRVVVFRATGDHFSAGADLAEFGTAPSLFAMRDARWARDVWGLLRAVAGAHDRVDAGQRGRVRVRARTPVRRPHRGRRLRCGAARGAGRHAPGGRREPDAAARGGDERGARGRDHRGAGAGIRRACTRVRRRGGAGCRTACPHRRARRPSSRRARPRRCERPRRRCGRRSTSRSPWAWRARPTSRRRCARRPDVAEWAPPSLGGCPHSRESSDPFPPVSDPEEYDKLRRRVLWKMPSGLYVLGSTGGRASQRHDHQLGHAALVRPEARGCERGTGGVHARAGGRRRRVQP